MKFGFYDSGLGGLIVLKEVINRGGCLDVVYLGDNANFPYGEKQRDELFKLGMRGVRFLFEKGADAVIIACNTLSTTVGEDLRKIFEKPLILITDFLGHFDLPKNSLIIGTNRTIESGFYQSVLNSDGVPTPKLAEFVEMGIWNGEEVENYLNRMLPEGYDNLVLACTHYAVLKGSIKKVRPKVKVFDISEMFADFFVKKFDLAGKGKLDIFLTGEIGDYSQLVQNLKLPCPWYLFKITDEEMGHGS